jgi:threonine dehydrogenase-like Zn-dependent dehydrogenase
MHAVDVAGPKMLDLAAIQGAGPIGLLITQLMKLHGARSVAISDIAQENLAVAKTVGADHIVNVAEGRKSLRELVIEITDGLGAERVFNTVGSRESIRESLDMLAAAGTVVLMATKDPEFSFPSLAISGERSIRTSSNALLSDFPKAVALLEAGMLAVDPLVTHRFPLSRAVDAFAVACSKGANRAIKIILDCQS